MRRPEEPAGATHPETQAAHLMTDIVDDLQHALTIRQVLHAELLHEAGVFVQLVTDVALPPVSCVEADARIRQELAPRISAISPRLIAMPPEL